MAFVVSMGQKGPFFPSCTIQISNVGLDKNGYQVYIFLITPQNMLWVLIRSTSKYFWTEKKKHLIKSYDLRLA